MPERIFLVYYRFRSATMLLSFILFLPFNTFAQNVTLGWDPNDEPDLAGYSVYGSRGSPGPPYDYIDSFSLNEIDPENPQCEVTDLEENISYYFVVTAYDTNDNESEPSHPPLCVKDGKNCLPSAVLTDIKANGSEGPITISTLDTLSAAISMQANNLSSNNCDWWCVAQTPGSWYSFVYESYQWKWIEGLQVTYMGPCADIPTTEVLNMKLPAGDFTFYFGVDDNMNGTVDGNLYYDSVDVTVEP